MAPWKRVGSDEAKEAWESFFAPFRFAEGVLSHAEQEHMFRCDIMTHLMGKEFLGSVPIRTVIGGNGTGKSKLLEAVGRTFQGPRFRAQVATEDWKDFTMAMARGRKILAMDNLDSAPDWAGDFICTYSTLSSVELRAYHTRSDAVEIPARGDLWISSRTPIFGRRPDVADRSVLYYLEAPTKRMSDNAFYARVDALRDGVLTYMVETAAEFLDFGGPMAVTTDFRMLSWAECAKAFSLCLDDTRDFESLLKGLRDSEAVFSLGDLTWFQHLRDWIAENHGRWVDAAEMVEEIQGYNNGNPVHIGKDQILTARSLGKNLNIYGETLKRYMGMESVLKRDGVYEYRFSKKAEVKE
jgi:hypothetical protein